MTGTGWFSSHSNIWMNCMNIWSGWKGRQDFYSILLLSWFTVTAIKLKRGHKRINCHGCHDKAFYLFNDDTKEILCSVYPAFLLFSFIGVHLRLISKLVVLFFFSDKSAMVIHSYQPFSLLQSQPKLKISGNNLLPQWLDDALKF